MKIAYLDSNVILAKYMPLDPYHSSSYRILEEKFVQNITSALTIVELAAVIGRQSEKIKFVDERSDVITAIEALSRTERIAAFIKFVLSEISVKFLSHLGTEDLSLAQERIRLFSDYARAYSYAPEFRLKSLDLLHLAALKNIQIEGKISVDYFVTADNEILGRKKEITRELDVTTIDPDTLVRVEAT